jgi:hypothetical protein
MKGILIFALLAVALGNKKLLDQESIIKEVNMHRKNWAAGRNKYFNGKTTDQIMKLMGALLIPEGQDLPY